MNKNNQHNTNGHSVKNGKVEEAEVDLINDNITLEEVYDNDDSYIKATVMRDGVKHEINVVSISEHELVSSMD